MINALGVRVFTPDEIKTWIEAEGGIASLKYVRVGDEYRFVVAGSLTTPDHKDMLNPGETPTSAAYVSVADGVVRVQGESMTLKMGRASDDEDNLRAIFHD